MSVIRQCAMSAFIQKHVRHPVAIEIHRKKSSQQAQRRAVELSTVLFIPEPLALHIYRNIKKYQPKFRAEIEAAQNQKHMVSHSIELPSGGSGKAQLTYATAEGGGKKYQQGAAGTLAVGVIDSQHAGEFSGMNYKTHYGEFEELRYKIVHYGSVN